MARVRAVLTDLDDTLFDHHRATRVALDAVVARHPGFRAWTLDELDRRHRAVLEELHLQVLAGRLSIDAARVERFRRLLRDACPTADPEVCAALAQGYREQYMGAFHAVAGAVDLLTEFKRAGLPVAVVTNNSVEEQRQKLARLGLIDLVHALVTSEEIGAVKPEAAIFRAALDRLGVDAAETVMLGDAWATDVEGARRAGIRPVWLNRFGIPTPDRSVAELASLEPVSAAFAVIADARSPFAGQGAVCDLV